MQQIGVQKRHGRDAHEARQRSGNQAKRSQIERQKKFQNKHRPHNSNEGNDALEFLLDRVLHGVLSCGSNLSRTI
jgi:hypothetical protein